ncbi:MAG: outer membrane beta-barrel protein [Saprospiraceae bacterium]|nr:outer membrane beta-barrel protein [Candidatus Defluviibacterium haderslevense]
MKPSPPIPESDNECPFKITVTFDKQNLTDKLMPKLKLLRPKIIFLNGFTQSIVSGIDIVCYLFHKTIRSITYAILIFCFILTSLGAQENNNTFDLIIRPSIGINKLIAHKDGQFSSIPTSSCAGLNVSISTLVEYKASYRIQITTGIGYKLNQFHTEINNILTNGNINNGLNPTQIKETYTNSYLTIPLLLSCRINDKMYVGTGISYDYLFNSHCRKKVINNTDPIFDKYGNIYYFGKYSLMLYYKYTIIRKLSIGPNISISPNRTRSELLSNSTGPSISVDLHFELRI